VSAGGPAEKAGLQAGDVVTELGGTKVNSSSDLVAAIADHAPGDQVKVTLRRGSRTLERTVTLGTQPAQTASAG
jgi:S1-C subfamily serine protease